MTRIWDEARFRAAYQRFVCDGKFQEEPSYYPRYISRYRDILRLYAKRAPEQPQRVLDIGGGQLGLMCSKLWSDDAEVADVGGEHLDYLSSQGVSVMKWNLCSAEQPVEGKYDAVIFSEVIEHLPIPGHVPLERLRRALKPGGLLICTTPNLYRLRNVVFLAMGKQIFDHFWIPTNQGLGHVLEYSQEHLRWQFERAGFSNIEIDFHQVRHSPNNIGFRLLYWLGSPLFLVPRFRDNLFAVGRNP